MKQIYKKISFLIHPILFSVYPVLFLFSHNLGQIVFGEIISPLLIVCGITIISFVIFYFLFKNLNKTSIAVFTFLLLFFSYGHLYEILEKIIKIKYLNFLLLAVYFLIFFFTVYRLKKIKSDLSTIINIVNIIAASLVTISLLLILKFECSTEDKIMDLREKSSLTEREKIDTTNLPDIYYIILDSYAGEESLKNIYNFNNSKFLDFLKGKGFFIASKGKSNYAHTSLSLASTLNMMYVNDLISTSGRKEKNMGLMYDLINNSAVQKKIKKYGYTIIHINSRSMFTTGNPYADILIDPIKINEFNYILIKTTILSPFLDVMGFSNIYRREILNTFRIIPTLANLDFNIFTFAHIMVPHPPYLFRKNQMPYKHTDRDMIGFQWDDKAGYIDQVIAVNSLVKEMITAILRNSEKMPVIILQGDHGTASLLGNPEKGNWENPNDLMLKERFDIFNAFLFPGFGNKDIPEDISSVNTFRYFFNIYLNADYKPLENKFYFSTFKDIFNLKDVTVIINKN